MAAGAIAILSIALAVSPGVSSAAPNKTFTVTISSSPAVPTPGEVVTFTATPPNDIEIRSYDWYLDGDGSIDSHAAAPTWSYPAPGAFTLRLHVTGNGNREGDAVHPVTVQPAATGGGPAPQPPVASFTMTPSAPVATQPVLFSSTSSDSDGTLVEQVWDLNGDGNYDNGGGATAIRSFADAGSYAIGLRVADDDGLVSFDSQTLMVQPAPGTAAVTTLKLGLRVLSPFPLVRIAGRITPRGTRVRLLRVKAPVRAKLTTRCNGRRCPFKKQVRTVPRRGKSRATASVRVRRLERLLLPGVRVRIYVTERGAVGKYTRFRFRAGTAPARSDSCILPGSWRPAECPAL